MILESTFTSVAAFASGFGAPLFVVRDKFDSESAVKEFAGPILIVHWDRDDLVAPSHARALAAAAPNATLRFCHAATTIVRVRGLEVRAFLSRNGLLTAQMTLYKPAGQRIKPT